MDSRVLGSTRACTYVKSLQGLMMHDVCQGVSVGSRLFSVAMTRWFDEALTAKRDRGEEGITKGVSEFKAA